MPLRASRRCLALLLLPTLTACVDGLGGLVANCAAEKNQVRRTEGRAPDSVQEQEIGGNFVERWTYQSGGRSRVYTFRWGVSYEGCEVDGPSGFALIPIVG